MNRRARKALAGRIRFVGCARCGETDKPLRKVGDKYYCPAHVPESDTQAEAEGGDKDDGG